jgi:hypothetical protein
MNCGELIVDFVVLIIVTKHVPMHALQLCIRIVVHIPYILCACYTTTYKGGRYKGAFASWYYCNFFKILV